MIYYLLHANSFIGLKLLKPIREPYKYPFKG